MANAQVSHEVSIELLNGVAGIRNLKGADEYTSKLIYIVLDRSQFLVGGWLEASISHNVSLFIGCLNVLR